MDKFKADIPSLLFRLEEDDHPRDSIGNFEAQYCRRRWESPLYYPVVDQTIIADDPAWLDVLEWPGGKTFAACLTHDVDTLQAGSRAELIRKIVQEARYAEGLSGKMKIYASVIGLRRPPETIDIFSLWVELERKYGFHSTFFFSASKAHKRHARDNVYALDDRTIYQGGTSNGRVVIRDLIKQGWDVGLHGSILSALDYDLLAEQKNDLEEAAGQYVASIRNHNLRYDHRITPAIQDRAGFNADSTLGFNRDIGFRAGTSYPFRFRNHSQGTFLDILQVSLIIQDGAVMRQDNLDLTEEYAFEVCRTLIDRVVATRGVISLLWHPDTVLLPGWFHVYERLLEYIHQKDGWGASVKEVHDWWKGRGLVAKFEKKLEDMNIEFSPFRVHD
jgi:peptidoglycan/xylan/chitin deacetylase (PgdA/CDA1 family)